MDPTRSNPCSTGDYAERQLNNSSVSGASQPTSSRSVPRGDDEESVENLADVLSNVFAHGNPKHALDGLGDGIRNVATGVALGVAKLATDMAMGGTQEGVEGAVKGFGMGLCSLLSFTAYGAFTGCRQVYRGIRNTPEAVSEVSRGEHFWDSSIQKWVHVNLEEDLKALPVTDWDVQLQARRHFKMRKEETCEEHPSKLGCSSHAFDTDASVRPASDESIAACPSYYSLLGVSATASATEIKKAFTQKALQMHPDKNQGDAAATQRFQELMQAYNILSNEETRAAYDCFSATEGPNDGGSSMGFNLAGKDVGNPMEHILGMNFLEPITGMLRFVVYFNPGVYYTDDMLHELHRRRRLRIAQHLLSFLNTHAENHTRATLHDAVSTRCGPQLVACAAEAYHIAARQYLYGNSWKRELDSWYSSKALSLSSVAGVTSSSAKLVIKAVKKTVSEEDITELLARSCAHDVSRTVLQACRLLLYDSSVKEEERQRRAQELDKLYEMAQLEIKNEIASREAARHRETESDRATSADFSA